MQTDKKGNFMKKKIILIATMLVMQMATLVHAATTASVKFELTSEMPKKDGGSIILLYSGEETDFYVELRPENEYKSEMSIPVGTYTLTEAISTIEKDYSYDLADTLAVTDGDNYVEVIVTNKDLTDELRQARAKDLTERNMKKEPEKDAGLKVGGEINTTADVKENTSKAPIVLLVILIVLAAVVLTVLTTLRANKKNVR